MRDNNKIIAGSIMSVLGILGVFATLMSMPENLNSLKLIFVIVGIALIITAAIFFTSYYIDFSNAISILKSAKKLGIRRIKENGLGEDELKNRLKKAKNIKMITTSGLIFFRTSEEEIISALVNNARISLILSRYNSEFITETEEIENRSKGEIKDELRQMSAIISRFSNEANKRTNNKTTGIINVKYFNTHLRLPFILIDDEYLWLTLTLPPQRSTQSHSLEIIKKESSLLQNCNKHFDELWASLPSDREISKITFDEFFEGVWKLEWGEAPNIGSEYFKIVDKKYYVDGEYYFDIDQIEFDYPEKKISFRKVGVKPNDNRKLVNELSIDNDNKLLGMESGNLKMTYYRK